MSKDKDTQDRKQDKGNQYPNYVNTQKTILSMMETTRMAMNKAGSGVSNKINIKFPNMWPVTVDAKLHKNRPIPIQLSYLGSME